MADEREGSDIPSSSPKNRDKAQTAGRDTSPGGERRSFDPARDGVPVSTNDGRLGPGGDPAEGKP